MFLTLFTRPTNTNFIFSLLGKKDFWGGLLSIKLITLPLGLPSGKVNSLELTESKKSHQNF